MLESKTYINEQCIACDGFGYIKKEDELFKNNAILIRIKNGGYVDIDNLKSILDYISVLKDVTCDGIKLGGLVMSTSAYKYNSLFVYSNSLRPYYNKEHDKVKNVSVRKLKKETRNIK